MGLIIPKYIEAAMVRGVPVKHKWKSSEHFEKESPKLEAQLYETSFRGILGIAAGVAEWIAWRFDGLGNCQPTFQFIEAVWAGQIDPDYTIRWEWPTGVKVEGPIERPLAHANGLLGTIFGLFTILENGICQETVYLTQLARYVVPNKSAFDNWSKTILARLAQSHPHDDADERGPLIARQIVDPDFDYQPEQTTDLVRDFLAGLDYKNNPYLRSPEDMISLGFKGTPYSI
jgi:hypothetical protein